MPRCIKQPHASACHSYAVRQLGLSTASQRWHYDMCRVASSNCMHQHATAMLSESWSCLSQASTGIMTCSTLHQATSCISMPQLCCQKEKWACPPQASVGTIPCARVHQVTACNSYAVKKLGLSTTSRRRHYDMCQVAPSNHMQHAMTCAVLPQANA